MELRRYFHTKPFFNIPVGQRHLLYYEMLFNFCLHFQLQRRYLSFKVLTNRISYLNLANIYQSCSILDNTNTVHLLQMFMKRILSFIDSLPYSERLTTVYRYLVLPYLHKSQKLLTGYIETTQ